MNSRFHEAAEAELAEAIDYYDGRVAGLGGRFLEEVTNATRDIELYPVLAPIIEEDVRAKVLVSFPFSVMYVVEEHELYILAIAHHTAAPATDWAVCPQAANSTQQPTSGRSFGPALKRLG